MRIRAYRPFPVEDIISNLKHVKVIGVLDRSGPFGAQGGPVFTEIRSAFYDVKEHPIIVDYVYGLGGRDMPPSGIEAIFNELLKVAETGKPEKIVKIVGVRE